MNLYKQHYDNTLIKDISSRLFYRNSFQIPKFQKISINIGIKEFILKKHITIFLLLEFVTTNCPILTKSKKSVPLLNVRKNSPNGAKLNMHRQKIYDFIQKLGFYIFPSFRLEKNNFIIKHNDSFSFSTEETDNFQELTFFYSFFKKIKDIDVNIKLICFLGDKLEILFFLTSLKLPVYFLRK